MIEHGTHRAFPTGAIRDTGEGKPDYDGYLSPLVLHAFGLHMLRHQKGPDGKYRPSDNWQAGIPMDQYMKSGWRHFIDVWCNHRGMKAIRKERIITALCALMFNIMGYLHEYLKANPGALQSFEEDEV